MNTYVDVTRPATEARRPRYLLAPTHARLWGGAVSIDGFTLARDPARTWIPMI
jgi:hypothetical protein